MQIKGSSQGGQGRTRRKGRKDGGESGDAVQLQGRVPRRSSDLGTRAGPWAAVDTGDHRLTGVGEPTEAHPRVFELGPLTHKYWLCQLFSGGRLGAEREGWHSPIYYFTYLIFILSLLSL